MIKLTLLVAAIQPISSQSTSENAIHGFYDFKIPDIQGNLINLNEHKGKIGLIVNVASFCGYTNSEYNHLNRLYETFPDRSKFEIFAFPCNQYGEQEPKDPDWILNFVRNSKKSKFTVFKKQDVWGKTASKPWQWINTQLDMDGPSWNFNKILVNENGEIIKFYDQDVRSIDLEPVIRKEISKMENKYEL